MPASRRRAVLAVTTAAALALGATACGDTEQLAPSADAAIQQRLDAVTERGIPGAQLVITEPDRGTHVLRAGMGNTATGEPIPDDARARIGSNTKAFVATVVMQLVDEGLVDLDTSVERYLPGIVAGNGNDGSRVTVRDLLQHTSGLTDYLAPGGAKPEDVKPGQLQVATSEEPMGHYTPAELVKIAMSLPPGPAAKDEAVYSNTNYILLGMLIEKVTGRPAGEEIDHAHHRSARAEGHLLPGFRGNADPRTARARISPDRRSSGRRHRGRRVVGRYRGRHGRDRRGSQHVLGGTASRRPRIAGPARRDEAHRAVRPRPEGRIRPRARPREQLLWEGDLGARRGHPRVRHLRRRRQNGRAVTLTLNHIPMSADSVDAAQQVVDAAMCAD